MNSFFYATDKPGSIMNTNIAKSDSVASACATSLSPLSAMKGYLEKRDYRWKLVDHHLRMGKRGSLSRQ
jgi:hypothetical protein